MERKNNQDSALMEMAVDKVIPDLFSLEKLLNEKEDRLRIYTICDACVKKVQVKGQGKLTEDEDVYVI